jgi:WD40 repeat protein
MLASGAGETIRFDLASGRFTTHELNVPQVSRQPTISPDGKLLIVPSSMGFAKFFDTSTYRETRTLSDFMFGVHGVGFTPDQRRLVIGSTAFEAITVWDTHNYERLLTLPASVGGLAGLAFSADGNVLAGQSGTGANAGTLFFWRAPSWAEIEKAEAAEIEKVARKATQ